MQAGQRYPALIQHVCPHVPEDTQACVMCVWCDLPGNLAPSVSSAGQWLCDPQRDPLCYLLSASLQVNGNTDNLSL